MIAPPALPAAFQRPDVEAAGFVSWKTWSELRASDYDLPKKPLSYVIYRDSAAPPR